VKILFLTDNFPPESNAPASRTYEHVRRWAAAGNTVTVITGAPNFPAGRIFDGYRNHLWHREVMDGIDVIRVWTYITANEGFLRRTLDYASFMVSATMAGLFVRKPDIIVATSPQFFTPCAAYVLSRMKRRPFVFELRDLWPDSIVAVGAMQESAVIRALKRLEYFLYRKASAIVSVTASFKSILVANGITPEKITIVRNGADLSTFTPGAKPPNLVERYRLQGKFVAAYIGTVGMAHGLGTVLDAAEFLRGNAEIALLVVGEGAERKVLEENAKARGLSNVVFVGAVSKIEVSHYWRLSDAALVVLRDRPLFRHVLPSKMFEAMATARPIVLGVLGESAELVEKAQAGIVVTPEDPVALARAIRQLAESPEHATALGANGRRFAEKELNRDHLAAVMLDELRSVAASP
jgi:glycosyltransferase involved in cell wall biosynthesis